MCLALSGHFPNANQHPFLETSTTKFCFVSPFAGLSPVLDSKLFNNRHYSLFMQDSLQLCTVLCTQQMLRYIGYINVLL